jgi:phospholipid-transporting ATPase
MGLFNKNSAKREPVKRIVHINSGEHDKNYAGNYTSTTKYSIWTFLPKALFEQYR